jgi:hypothetical protein
MVAAMILCDVGYQDNQSRKITLVGVFHEIRPRLLPEPVGCCLFLRLLDGRGNYPLILRITEEETGITLAEHPITVVFRNPLEPLDTLIPMRFDAIRYTTLLLSVLDKHNVIGSLRLPVEKPKP